MNDHRLQCRINDRQHALLNKHVEWGSQGRVLKALLDVLLILADRSPSFIYQLIHDKPVFATAVANLLMEVPKMSLLEELRTEISQLSDTELAEMLKGVRSRRSTIKAKSTKKAPAATRQTDLAKLSRGQLEELLKVLGG